jgi:Acetamidase/Formamidase family
MEVLVPVIAGSVECIVYAMPRGAPGFLKQDAHMPPLVGDRRLSAEMVGEGDKQFVGAPPEASRRDPLLLGEMHYVDATVSYADACTKAINYLSHFGYTEEQAYIILSCAPCEGRISAIVDIPSACCTLALPIDAFEFDVTPNADGPVSEARGSLATAS